MRIFILFLLVFSNLSFAQKNTDKEQIQQVMKDFFSSIKEQDSVKFNTLFFDNVNWIGVYKEKSFKQLEHRNHKAKPFFISDYKEFLKSISGEKPAEEKYDNVKIIQDGTIASVNFDYSFWYDKKMLNWGKEIWTMVKIYDKWRITSVVFSMEMTEFYKQPSLKQRLKEN